MKKKRDKVVDSGDEYGGNYSASWKKLKVGNKSEEEDEEILVDCEVVDGNITLG